MKSTLNTYVFLSLLVFSALFGGLVYAHNKVVVIPLGSESTVNIDALLERIVVLETKLACVDAISNESIFNLQGCDVSIIAPRTVAMKVGTGGLLKLEGSAVEIDGSDVSIDSSGVASIKSSVLNLDGAPILVGGVPVARVGSQVSVNPNTGIGTVIQ